MEGVLLALVAVSLLLLREVDLRTREKYGNPR